MERARFRVGRRPGCVFFRRYFAISRPARGAALHFSSFVNCSCTWTSCARRHTLISLSLSLFPSLEGVRRIFFFLKSFRSWLDSDVLVLTRYRVQTTLEPQTFNRSIRHPVYTEQTGENKKWFSNHESALCHARSGLKFNRRTRNTARRATVVYARIWLFCI